MKTRLIDANELINQVIDKLFERNNDSINANTMKRLIDKQPEIMKPIKVMDGYPKSRVDVLAWIEGREPIIAWYSHEKRAWINSYVLVPISEKITHWAPIPSAPEDER